MGPDLQCCLSSPAEIPTSLRLPPTLPQLLSGGPCWYHKAYVISSPPGYGGLRHGMDPGKTAQGFCFLGGSGIIDAFLGPLIGMTTPSKAVVKIKCVDLCECPGQHLTQGNVKKHKCPSFSFFPYVMKITRLLCRTTKEI